MTNTVLLNVLKVSLLLIGFALAFGANSRVKITVVDSDTGKPVPCQIYLKDQAGNAIQAPDLPFWRGHFVAAGHVELDLLPGK
jgi:hypothetical protein